MPELPEVETIRRQLAPHVVGRTVHSLDVFDARWTRPLAPSDVVDAVVGRDVRDLGRRGKYLIWTFGDDVFVLQHLRMTGTLLWEPADADARHERARFDLDGHRLSYCDPRRFGTAELVVGEAARDAFLDARLGYEPFDAACTPAHLRDLARGRTAPIKAFLLDQRRIAGVGNIYADEALFAAQLHPLRPVGAVTLSQWDVLHRAVCDALAAGIDAGGATIDDFRHVDGVYGGFQHNFRVHLREGQPCDRCATPIVKFVAAGRGTYACLRCQPAPRARRRPRAAKG